MGNLRKVIASISLVAVLSTFAVTNAAFAKSPFTDVPDNHWFTTEGWDVKVKDAGIFTKTTAMPDQNVIRADMAVMVDAAAGLQKAATTLEAFPSGVFTDVKSTDYWYKALQAGRQFQVFSEKLKFDATGLTNRAQAAKVVVQAFGLAAAAPKTAAFSDVKLGYTGADAWMNNIYTAYCYGLVKGINGKFMPGDNVTRAQLAKMLVVAKDAPALITDCTKSTTTPDTTPPVTTTGGSVTVSMDADSPAVSVLADGTAFNKLLTLDVSGGSKGANINELTVTTFGKVSDTNLKVSVWEGSVREGNVVSVSEGKATVVFNTPIEVAAGGDVKLDVAVNLDATIGSGTVGAKIASASDVVIDGGTVDGTFPISSPEFGIVDGSNSVAAVTFDVVNLASTNRAIDPQTAYKITTFKLSETSSKEDVTFSGITLFNNGNTSDSDLKNITVKDQDGNPLGSVDQTTDKIANIMFDKPYTLKKGTARNFDVYVDVTGGSTRTAQFIVQNDYDVVVTGSNSAAGIIATAGTLTDTAFPMGDLTTGNSGYNFVTVNEGSASLAKDNSSPSGDMTLGASDVVLGTFTVQAQGEDVELQKIALDFSNGSSKKTTTSNATSYFDCVQTSSSDSTCSATSQNDLQGSVKVVTSEGKTLYTVSADTLSLWNNSPSYATLSAYQTVKAGESMKFNIVGSLGSNSTYTGAGENLTVGVNKMYYYKKSSLKFANTGSATANSMSVTTSSLAVTSDTSYGAQTVVHGTSSVKIGSFKVKGSSSEKVNVTSIALKVDNTVNTVNSDTVVTNLKVYKGSDNTGTQLGTTQSSVPDNSVLTLSVGNLMLGLSEEAQVVVYADISSSFTGGQTLTTTVSASGVSGTGQTSQSSASGPSSALPLQTVSVVSGGTLTVSTASDTPIAKVLVAGTPYTDTNGTVAKFRFAATKAEDIYLKQLTLRIDNTTNAAAVSDAVLYGSADNTALGDVIGTVSSIQAENSSTPGYLEWTWSGANRPKVASNSSYYVTVKADIVSSGQTSVSGKSPTFILSNVKAEGSAAITPTIIGAFADSTATLTSDSGVAVNDGAACQVNGNLTADATSLTVKTCALAGVPTLFPVGTNILVGSEQMLVTATSNPILTVTRGYNGSTAATHSDSDAIKYAGKLAASSANNVVVVSDLTVLPGASSCTAQAESATACTGAVGDFIEVGSEHMYVYAAYRNSAGAYDLLYVVRGANGTTIAAAAGAVAVNDVATPGKVAGNAMTVYDTKLTVAANTTGLSSAAMTAMELAKIVFSATPNTTDTAENKATITKMRITVTATNASASNFVMYPDEHYNDSSYGVTGKYVADSVVEFNFGDSNADGSADTTFSDTPYDEVVEGHSQTYDIKADTISGTNGALSVQLANTGTSSSAAYGSSGDVSWTDGTSTPIAWINQSGTLVPLRDFSSSASTGTPDTTAPALSSAASGGDSNNTLDSEDTITLTFSEPMSQLTFTNVTKISGGQITANLAAQNVTAGTLLTFGTPTTGATTFTPSWNSSTVFVLTAGTSTGTGPTGTVTPSQTLFMDVSGNAATTSTPTLSGTY